MGFPYKRSDWDYILCECNYSYEDMLDFALSNEESRSDFDKHLEIGQTIEILQHNISECTKKVLLLHMSSRNIKKKKALAQVIEETGFNNIDIATKGLVVNL